MLGNKLLKIFFLSFLNYYIKIIKKVKITIINKKYKKLNYKRVRGE